MHKADGIPTHTLPAKDFLISDQSPHFGEHWPSHRISFYAVVWFRESKGNHFIDFESYPVRKNRVYFIGKHQVHSIPARSLPKALTIVFSTDFFQRIEEPFLRQLFLPFDNAGFQIPAHMVKPMEQLFELILLEYNGAADADLLLKYTTAFLFQLHRFSGHSFSLAAEDQRMLQLFQLIETHYKENRSTTFYAQKIGLTAKRINEILREKASTTISQLCYQLLLIEAKRELFHGQAPVKTIAYDLGFSDQSYFARFFRKHTGVTPEQFRELQQHAGSPSKR